MARSKIKKALRAAQQRRRHVSGKTLRDLREFTDEQLYATGSQTPIGSGLGVALGDIRLLELLAKEVDSLRQRVDALEQGQQRATEVVHRGAPRRE